MSSCVHHSAIAAVLACTAGCSSITGLDGSSQYACKAPEGVKCESVSGNYHNALQNNLPSQRRSTGAAIAASRPEHQRASGPVVAGRADPSSMPPVVATAAGVGSPVPGPAWQATPLRSGPRVLRLWIKPWEDADRDLNGESLVYVQVDNGRWLVDHVQRQAREAYRSVRPARLPASAGKAAPTEPRQTDARPAQATGQSPADDGPAVATSVTEALRALQGRPAAAPDN